MNLITERQPPRNRAGAHDGKLERHLTEPAVMLAMAQWLFAQGATDVLMHPDGMHMKGFDIPRWLEEQGFARVTTTGRRGTSGAFSRGKRTLTVHCRAGLGDVVATVEGRIIEIEAKGGCLNTHHPGQISRLRRGLHEAVGQLMGSPREVGRLIAAVPRHRETERVTSRLIKRCSYAGVEIALVDGDGNVNLEHA